MGKHYQVPWYREVLTEMSYLHTVVEWHQCSVQFPTDGSVPATFDDQIPCTRFKFSLSMHAITEEEDITFKNIINIDITNI